VTKLGGVIGAVLGIALVLYVGDHIDWTARQSDWIGSAAAVAGGVVGWAAGSRVARRLALHRPQRTH
jgi:drug/metabolite transporter (DMT)-like permease